MPFDPRRSLSPSPHCAAAGSPAATGWYRLAALLIPWMGRHAELRRQRRALGRLDDRLLCDIGVSRTEAEREARGRAIWPF